MDERWAVFLRFFKTKTNQQPQIYNILEPNLYLEPMSGCWFVLVLRILKNSRHLENLPVWSIPFNHRQELINGLLELQFSLLNDGI